MFCVCSLQTVVREPKIESATPAPPPAPAELQLRELSAQISALSHLVKERHSNTPDSGHPLPQANTTDSDPPPSLTGCEAVEPDDASDRAALIQTIDQLQRQLNANAENDSQRQMLQRSIAKFEQLLTHFHARTEGQAPPDLSLATQFGAAPLPAQSISVAAVDESVLHAGCKQEISRLQRFNTKRELQFWKEVNDWSLVMLALLVILLLLPW